jgi:ACS family D-galactonate transporter-like MFS transporter
MAASAVRGAKPATRLRWMIAWMTMSGTAISYIDRANLAVSLPFMESELHIGKQVTGVLLACFFFTYAPGQLIGGRLVDAVGPRLAAGFATIWWSIFTAANAVAGGLTSLVIFRLGLGIGEAVGPPAFGKVVCRWFPLRERALAAAVYDSGSRLGTALALPIVTVIIAVFGWRASFLITGCIGLVWVIGWFRLYRDPAQHPRLHPDELAYIERGGARTVLAAVPDAPKPRWVDLLRYRTIWGMMLGFFGLNFAFYFFVTWFPSYLVEARGLSLLKTGFLGMIPPLAAFGAEFVGGWWSDRLTSRYGPTRGRKIPIVVSMCLASSIALAAVAPTTGLAIVLLALSMSCLAIAASSIWSLPADVAPSEAQVGSVGGLQNFASNLAGILSPIAFGFFAGSGPTAFVVPLVATGGVVVLGALSYLVICGRFEPLPSAAVAPRRGVREKL